MDLAHSQATRNARSAAGVCRRWRLACSRRGAARRPAPVQRPVIGSGCGLVAWSSLDIHRIDAAEGSAATAITTGCEGAKSEGCGGRQSGHLATSHLPSATVSSCRSAPAAAARVVHVADLGLRIELVHLPAALAVAVAGLLHAAERQVRLGADRRRVDVRDAVVELAASRGTPGSRRACRATTRARTSRRCSRANASSASFTRITESTGPKISSCSMRMPGFTPVKIVGWKKKPLLEPRAGRRAGRRARARRPPSAPISDVALDLRRRDASWMSGPTSVPAFAAVAELQRLARASTSLRHELVVDPVLQDQAARGRAALAGGAERAPEHAVEREVEVGVVQHDLRVLAAHLERQALVHAPAGLADDAARLGGAGERDHAARPGCSTSAAPTVRPCRARAGSPRAAARPRAGSRRARARCAARPRPA